MKPGPAPRNDWDSLVWTCTGECKETLPLEDFYRCKTRKNGRVSKCKKCFIVYAEKPVRRKMMVIARSPKATKRTMIIEAVKSEARTREELIYLTRIHEDVLCDLLAEMVFDDGELKLDRISRRFRAA